VTRGWRKLHNEKLRDLNSWPNMIRIIRVCSASNRNECQKLKNNNVSGE
jgi:hypothetical protein